MGVMLSSSVYYGGTGCRIKNDRSDREHMLVGKTLMAEVPVGNKSRQGNKAT